MAVRTLQAEPVLLAGAELAEGPRWDARTQRLLWVDILAGAVHAFDPVSCGDVRRDLGRHVGAVAPYGEDGLVAAVREGIVRLNADGSEQVLAPVLAEHPGLRFNDGRADRAGRFWADTLSYRMEPGRAALFRLDGAGCTEVVDGVGLGNGLDWSPDDRTFYFVDTLAQTVDAFDFDLDTGALARRRRFLDIDPGLGSPDGLTVDADGGVWLALYGGGQVHRYTPDGVLDTIVAVPAATQTTSVGFGGPGLDVLFVTTAREHLDAAARAAQTNAGGILAVRPGTVGQPTASYAP
jgi:sugar lactone lactonase YvrE